MNAFALPGGYIYVTRGLLAYLENEAQLAVVLGQQFDRRDLAKPIKQRRLKVADGDQFHLNGEMVENEPAGEGAGCFPALEAAADDADTESGFHERDRERVRGPGFSASAGAQEGLRVAFLRAINRSRSSANPEKALRLRVNRSSN